MADEFPISRVQALLLTRAGADAFRAGRRPDSCPYALASERLGERFAGYYWMRGWWIAAS